MPSKEVMLRIARMKFVHPVSTNEEIAEALFRDGVLKTASTKRVKELIEQAGQWLMREQERLEEIEHNDTEERSLAQKLCDTFPLIDARVVPGGEPTEEGHAPLHPHAKAAAVYFDEVVGEAEDTGDELVVAVSGGETILDMVTSLPDLKRPKVHYYSAAVIGRGRQTLGVAHVAPETNATIAWSRSGKLPGHLCYGTADPYRFDEDRARMTTGAERHEYARRLIASEVERLCRNKSIRDVLEDMSENINMSIAGLGLLLPTALDSKFSGEYVNRISMNYLLHRLGIDLNILAAEGAVGDINYAMFDRKGSGNQAWRFFITAGEGTAHSGPSFYHRLVARGKKVMVIAGVRKEAVLLPAMNARLFNVLVTDSYTANRLLRAVNP
jgi:DNA-binding transcriptional regulator LsrR (DeoR family)